MKISDRIKKIREQRNLSQQQLADKMGVKKSLIAQWETNRNNPRLENLTKICEMFAVPADWILFGKEFSNTSTSSDNAIRTTAELTAHDIFDFLQSKEQAIAGQNKTISMLKAEIAHLNATIEQLYAAQKKKTKNLTISPSSLTFGLQLQHL